MINTGLDLVHPVDRQPPGAFPVEINTRVVEEGRLEARPGYSLYDGTAPNPHSMRRLNDPDDSVSASGYTNIVGSGISLFAGPQGSLVPVDVGYSGNPLSLLRFRPDQSPETWMYVYDQNKSAKVNPAGVVQPIGVPPPAGYPGGSLTYGPPASVDASTGQSTSGWSGAGTAGSPTLGHRIATDYTIQTILYDSGTSGWCVIIPVGTLVPAAWGNRMKAILSSGSEEVLVREVHPPCGSTTISGISYYSGTTGRCVIVLAAQPSGTGGDLASLARNSIIQLGGGEYVKILSVTLSPDGSTYSIECSTTVNHIAGELVLGQYSWYLYTTGSHAAGEGIKSDYIYAAIATGTPSQGILETSASLDLSVAGTRPIDPANDYLHVSVYIDVPTNLGYFDIRIYMGAAASDDYYSWTVTPDLLVIGWNELTLPIAQAIRNGLHTGESLAVVDGLQLIANTNGALTFGFDWWYLFGTYGPTVPQNDPVGLSYCSRNRNSGTGAASVPAPAIRYQLFPLREQVLVTPQAAGAPVSAYVDSLDIYRLGGSITNFTYVGTVPNNPGSPQTYADNLPDSSIAASPQADFTLLQPWPILQLPRSGVVNVTGTRVQLVSGSPFDLALLSASVILINGVAYQTYGQPESSSVLDLFLNAGVQSGVPYLIASPVLAGQPLPFAFGPLEGPLTPVAFALGDPVNGGNFYYSNSANLDAASDQNIIEVCSPSEPLVSGAVWNGLVIVGSRDNLYLTRYSYLQTLGIPGQTTFQFQRLPSPSGMWSRWSVVAGPDGVYFLGRDGIYRATEQGAQSITDERLYPIFPHDGQAGTQTYNTIAPDMTNLSGLRLSAGDQDIYFDYAPGSS